MSYFKKFVVLFILIFLPTVLATEGVEEDLKDRSRLDSHCSDDKPTEEIKISKKKRNFSVIEERDERPRKTINIALPIIRSTIEKEEKTFDRWINLRNKSVCVHLTHHFPKGGKMIAGATIGKDIIPSDRAMPARSSVHFSWNKPISIKANIDKEILKRNYAIIETFKALEFQWYGGYHEDIVIIGNYELSKDAVIFVPEEEYESLKRENPNNFATIISYSKKSSAEKAAETYIKDKLDIKVESVNPGTFNDFEIRINGETVKAKEIFQPVLGVRHWGIHEESLHGIVDSILGYLNHNFRGANIDKTFLEEILEPREIERALVLLSYNREKLREEVETHSKIIKTFLQERDPVLDKWLELLKLEVNLRKDGKSIFQKLTVLHKLMNNLIKEDSNTHETNEQIIIGLHPAQRLEPTEFESFYQTRLKSPTDPEYPFDQPIFFQVIRNMKLENIIEMITSIHNKYPNFKIDFRTFCCIAREKNWMDKMPDFDQLKCLLPDICHKIPSGLSVIDALGELRELYKNEEAVSDKSFFYGMGFKKHKDASTFIRQLQNYNLCGGGNLE